MNMPSLFNVQDPMRVLAVLVIAVLIVAGCSSPESAKKSIWTPYAQSSDYEFFYDSNNIGLQDGSVVMVSIKRRLKGEWPVIPETKHSLAREMKKRQKAGMSIQGYENWDHEVVVCEIDCRMNAIRFLKSTNFDHKGNILDAIAVPESILKWEGIIPGTINDSLRQTVCRVR